MTDKTVSLSETETGPGTGTGNGAGNGAGTGAGTGTGTGPAPAPGVSSRQCLRARRQAEPHARQTVESVYVGSKQSDLTLTVEYEHAHKTLL